MFVTSSHRRQKRAFPVFCEEQTRAKKGTIRLPVAICGSQMSVLKLPIFSVGPRLLWNWENLHVCVVLNLQKHCTNESTARVQLRILTVACKWDRKLYYVIIVSIYHAKITSFNKSFLLPVNDFTTCFIFVAIYQNVTFGLANFNFFHFYSKNLHCKQQKLSVTV